MAHIHVRDPDTGAARRDPTSTARWSSGSAASGTDVVLNLTAGMGGDLVFGPPEQPLPPAAGTDMAGATERLAHVAELPARNLHARLRHDEFRRGRLRDDQHARHAEAPWRAQITTLGVKPEIEVFDTGHLWLAKWLVDAGRDRGTGAAAALHGHPLGRADDLPR